MNDRQNCGPSPDLRFPIPGVTRVCYLKNIIKNPNIIVGDYTYYDDFDNPENFEKNVLYHFDFIGDRLMIGKFCAIASDVKFIMNGGNHQIDGISTYPFSIFQKGWEIAAPEAWPHKGDTRIGNDVWLGYNATIMPGVCVGDGAIVAVNSTVTKDVSPYTIVGGNPATTIRQRFSDREIEKLLKIAWWNWDIEKITTHLKIICSNDIEALLKVNEL
ncbi:MAG: CatB-related O-acetyltransferase [Cyanobacteria bacterium P01_E01_bin.42]